MSDAVMGEKLGLTRAAYRALKFKKTAKAGYPNLAAAVKNLNLVFEHDGLVFGPRNRITPTIENPFKGADRLTVDVDSGARRHLRIQPDFEP